VPTVQEFSGGQEQIFVAMPNTAAAAMLKQYLSSGYDVRVSTSSAEARRPPHLSEPTPLSVGGRREERPVRTPGGPHRAGGGRWAALMCDRSQG